MSAARKAVVKVREYAARVLSLQTIFQNSAGVRDAALMKQAESGISTSKLRYVTEYPRLKLRPGSGLPLLGFIKATKLFSKKNGYQN